MSKFKFEGYIDYPEVGKIYDSDVYKLILDHSRLIDRLSRPKMVEMSLLGQNILMGIFDGIDPKDKSWKFYGRHAIKP